MNLQWRRVVGTKLYLFPFKAAFRGHMSMSSDSSCFIYNIISDQEANSAVPDQTTGMCRLIWIYTVRPWIH